ncbi:hypothetical protein LTR48_003467 [Friedmanniomyces endolithicus]|uniref:F-box domain-containing protein n=1 Tax=Rachicladosporium monterosium TaxID=1507873 RepID=A0ABR0L873_9PEZI|nr:hypothetical protein LTR29_002238 [Friedmanniomyces endolithicus]KAK1092874.1 hypothetical protein LTR48_003467 [Friedmanniomyces endolithicus]KAK5144951.1 hypothetical protein LTR32_003214 [Rachicladosporium monterosium]
MSLGATEHQQEELGALFEIAVATPPSSPSALRITTYTISEMADGPKSLLFTLPPELREMVYDFALGPKRFYLDHATRDPVILQLSRQIRLEALPRFYKHTNFCFNGKYPSSDAFRWLVARPKYVIRLIVSIECVYRSARTGGARSSGRTMEEYFRTLCKKDLRQAGIVLRKGVLRTVAEEALVAEDDR